METASAKELFVLGRVSPRPTHGHEIMRTLRASRADLWVDLSEKHVYYVLRKLEREGLIREVQAMGGRAARRVYTITAAGRRELAEMLRADSFVESIPYSEFDVAFGMLCTTDVLSDAERATVLARRRVALENAVAAARAAQREADGDLGAGGLPRVMMDKVARLAAAEIAWLDDVTADIGARGWDAMRPVVPNGDDS